jgi:hypothetical protein
LLPLAYILAFGVLGLWVNIRMPRLDWVSERSVKQGERRWYPYSLVWVPALRCYRCGRDRESAVAPITFAVLILFTIWMWSSLVRSGEKAC